MPWHRHGPSWRWQGHGTRRGAANAPRKGILGLSAAVTILTLPVLQQLLWTAAQPKYRTALQKLLQDVGLIGRDRFFDRPIFVINATKHAVEPRDRPCLPISRSRWVNVGVRCGVRLASESTRKSETDLRYTAGSALQGRPAHGGRHALPWHWPSSHWHYNASQQRTARALPHSR